MSQVIVFSLFFGLAFGGGMVVFSLLLVEVFGVELFSRVMGVMGIPFMVGMALGPLVGGVVFDHFGHYRPAILFMSGLFVVCAALILSLRASGAGTTPTQLQS